MKVTDIQYNKSKDTASFVLKDILPAQANTFRRAIMSLVPTLAIEEVEFSENSSALYDEVIAHRLGLLPLTTDLGAYKLRSEFPDDGVHRPECEVKLSLEAKGPCTVYAEQLVSKDPAVKCAHPKSIIVKLLKGQTLKFEAVAVLGQGTEHAKWAAGAAYFQQQPLAKDGKKEVAVEPKHLIESKSQELFIKKDGSANIEDIKGSEISSSPTDYIFTVESWGQLDPMTMVKEALNQINAQVDQVAEAAKGL